MTVTDQEARAITYLAIAVRKTLHRAPTWDEPGTYDNIIRCRDMSLPEVILRTIRAAADRDAITPGVIPKNGPHANEVLKAPKWEPDVIPPEQRCSVCNKAKQVCETSPRFADDTHRFEPDFKTKRGNDVIEIVDALKAELAPMRDPKTTATPEPGAGRARIEISEEKADG